MTQGNLAFPPPMEENRRRQLRLLLLQARFEVAWTIREFEQGRNPLDVPNDELWIQELCIGYRVMQTRLDAAWSRLENYNNYGSCIRCGGYISLADLRAFAFKRRCKSCDRQIRIEYEQLHQAAETELWMVRHLPFFRK